MPLERADPTRFEFDRSLTQSEIRSIIDDPRACVLQASDPVESKTWDLINDQLLPQRPDILIRVYGFYGQTCDLSFLTKLNQVRRLSIDCLMNATGIENVVHLSRLESLDIGIYDLESFNFLKDVPASLRSLGLLATKSKKPSLELLLRFQNLSTLYLEGQQKQIEVLSHLKNLTELTLRSISTPDLSYVAELPKLSSLDIKLGGIRDLSAIAEKESIKVFALWLVRGLDDISVISTLYGLQYLFLQSLKQVRALPDFSRLQKLRRIWIEDMKGLEDVSSLEGATSLEEYAHCSAQNVSVEQYEFLTRMSTLKKAFIGFGSAKKNQLMNMKLADAGIAKLERVPFVFV